MQRGFIHGAKPTNQWTPFTPWIWGTTTDPVLGANPNLRGRYALYEGVCTVHYSIQCDSTGVSGGAGAYILSAPPGLPPMQLIDPGFNFGPQGSIWFKCAGLWTTVQPRVAQAGSGKLGFEMRYVNAAVNGSLVQVVAGTPGNLANSDQLFGQITYEVAP